MKFFRYNVVLSKIIDILIQSYWVEIMFDLSVRGKNINQSSKLFGKMHDEMKTKCILHVRKEICKSASA